MARPIGLRLAVAGLVRVLFVFFVFFVVGGAGQERGAGERQGQASRRAVRASARVQPSSSASPASIESSPSGSPASNRSSSFASPSSPLSWPSPTTQLACHGQVAGDSGSGQPNSSVVPAVGQLRILDERGAKEHLALQQPRGATLGLDLLERRGAQQIERAGRIADRPQRFFGDADLLGARA